ncbi:hypothetical protein A2U01_0007326 [Trifolium medium]|uniref:Uncharacterized protein n=1 Tax=Trifolium medium TaxID=97028 RepID=A0A392MHE5_9FABA|nr:hypothetical protein [Trifolium medium]
MFLSLPRYKSHGGGAMSSHLRTTVTLLPSRRSTFWAFVFLLAGGLKDMFRKQAAPPLDVVWVRSSKSVLGSRLWFWLRVLNSMVRCWGSVY